MKRPTIVFSLAVAAWLATLIATPISMQKLGDGIFPALAGLGVLTQAAAALLGLHTGKPWRWVLGTAAAVGAFTWAVEWVGSTTGFPFGQYHYTEHLQPQLLGVPLLIPLAWLMMLAPTWGVVQIILKGRGGALAFAALSGLAFTAWDLYLDPQMTARELWVWETPGGYFGIPWSNYFGWWLSATALTLLLRPQNLPARPLLLIYALTWAFEAVGLSVFWGQPGPALAGFAGMGIFVGLAAWRLRSSSKKTFAGEDRR